MKFGGFVPNVVIRVDKNGGLMFFKTKSNINRVGLVLATLILSLAFISMPAIAKSTNSEAELWDKIKIFTLVLHEVREKFVEVPASDEMIYGSIRGMLATLDPHSSFLTPEEMKDFQQETSGSFFGVGIEITVMDYLPTVISPIEGSPADRAGLRSGDKIIQVDGVDTQDMSLLEVVKLIRGDKGTKVTFTISRDKPKAIKTYTMVRDLIPILTVRSEVLEPGYGYLRISSFQGETFQEVKKALAELGDIKGLILDVRNDPGGLLDQSIKISSVFLGPDVRW